jgi:hypothetical protein
MEYPKIPTDLKSSSYYELARTAAALRDYKNVTILGIRYWRTRPDLLERMKEVSADQRRIHRELRTRPEACVQKESPKPTQQEKMNTGDRVHSRYHDADGELIRIEWSPRVGMIYHVRLVDGRVVYCARTDLTKKEE